MKLLKYWVYGLSTASQCSAFLLKVRLEQWLDVRVSKNIYMREGCYACHSQMIRTLKDDVDRYGPYSLAAESQYDHPMLWGSKRTGPDLARLGDKYSDQWHTQHLINPRDVVPQSIMPAYGWLQKNELKTDDLHKHLAAQRKVGVPYSQEMIDNAISDAKAQANPDFNTNKVLRARYGERTSIRFYDGQPEIVSEMDALVAYLQILGRLTELPYQKTKQ